MTIQKQWDKYEAAVLLDNYLKYINGNITRKEAIESTSTELRNMAISKNVEIDEIYRNVNGISFQMHSMESAYCGYTIMKPASKLFKEIVDIYENEFIEYKKILAEARRMISNQQSNKDKFVSWLANEVSLEQLSELFMDYNIIDEFCNKYNVYKGSLLDITDLYKIKKIQKFIETNRVFKFKNKRSMLRINVAIKYFLNYVVDSYIDETLQEKTVVKEKVESKVEDNHSLSLNENAINKGRIRSTIEGEAFFEWLRNCLELAEPTCRSYVSAVNCAEAFARENNFENQHLYTEDLNEAEKTVEELLNNPAFVEMDNKQNHRYRAALYKLLQYICKDSVYQTPSDMFVLTGRIRNTKEADAFYDWLYKKQGLAEPTCRSYVSAVNCAEAFAKDNNFIHQTLYTSDRSEAYATVNELLSNAEFIELDNKQHHRFKSGLNRLLQYVDGDHISTEKEESSIDNELFKGILIERFPRGYRTGSPLELRKFKRFWEGIYGVAPERSDEELSKIITSCGIVHEDKVYMPQKMLDDDTRMKLFSYINKSFLEGKNVIYYEALFKEFSDDFLEHCMYNAEMLKAYLTYMNDNSYYIGKNFISKEANVRVTAYDEVKQCLEQKAMPMGYDEIYETLSHIPQQKIRNIIAQNSEFISNGRNEYFHISIFNISDDELEDISIIIQTAIDEKQFIGGNELVGSIKKKHPYIIDQNALLSDKGLRDAIGYKLVDQFSFKGNIISRKGQALSMMGVFSDFCKQRSSFSLDELKILRQELDTVIYFEAVYANSLRISKDQFVSKNNAAFLPAETDEAIDRFCFGDYIPLGKITHFGSFPDAGFQWNSFLLEHYVAMYSSSYKLVHSNYNEGVCVGAIVKKVSNIDTMDELIVDVLANNRLPLQKEKSLQYLCDEGYLARRSYAGIEQLLIKAKELRNQKGL